MLGVVAHLSTPVTAVVTQSFGTFQQGQQVLINRVTRRALMFGVEGRNQFIPQTNVDDLARESILSQVNQLGKKTSS